MSRFSWLVVPALAGLLAIAPEARAQSRPYIGYVYPAGGQQGTTFQVKLGGQGIDRIDRVVVSGEGVTVKVLDYLRKIGPQDMSLLREQITVLRRGPKAKMLASLAAPSSDSGAMMVDIDNAMMAAGTASGGASAGTSTAGQDRVTALIMSRIEKRLREYVNRPACVSISSLVIAEVTVAPDAKPGQRELRLATPRGVSNPLVFHVGQVPETARKPMLTSDFQVLGKEWLAQRKRPPDEVEVRIQVPCTMNGQIASGEVNQYRFEALKGQRLVISVAARQLIPYLADAVPGWFQPVLAVYDAAGQELAYNDDYRFKPDPTLMFEVPKDGEYVLAITDAIYRGREDFVYRLTIGELPFVTSIFPLGCRAGVVPTIEMKGWNLQKAKLAPPPQDAKPGVHRLVARKDGLLSNTVPFAVDTLSDCLEAEPNNDRAHAQKVKLPIIVNGRIDRPDDWDVFQFTGRAGETIVAEVMARRLDSPLDSMVRITDAAGKLVAMNDDHQDLGSGLNTHHADSYVMTELPADGTYYVHLSDAARSGGEEYGYRLRISRPRPDFALRVAPSSTGFRNKGSTTVSVYVIRTDGFNGTIKLGLKDPPPGFSTQTATLSGTQPVTRLTVKGDLKAMKEPIMLLALTVEGRAKVGDKEIVREAVPAEDRMQAFLWRHLVPAEEFKVLVYDGSYTPPPKRVAPERPVSAETQAPSAATTGEKKFTKGQVAGRLRQLRTLYEDFLLTDDFYARKVEECETGGR